MRPRPLWVAGFCVTGCIWGFVASLVMPYYASACQPAASFSAMSMTVVSGGGADAHRDRANALNPEHASPASESSDAAAPTTVAGHSPNPRHSGMVSSLDSIRRFSMRMRSLLAGRDSDAGTTRGRVFALRMRTRSTTMMCLAELNETGGLRAMRDYVVKPPFTSISLWGGSRYQLIYDEDRMYRDALYILPMVMAFGVWMAVR